MCFGYGAEEAGGLGAVAFPVGAVISDHRLEHQPGRLEVLRRPRGCEEGDRTGADGESFDVAEFLDLAERVEPDFPREIEQRLGADADVRIAQHHGRLVRNLLVTAGAEQRECAPSDLAVRMGEKSPQCGMPGSALLPFDQRQRIAHLRRDRWRRACP